MRLLIDLQGAQTDSRFRGIGRYSLSLAHAIARQKRGHEIFLLLNARLPQAIPAISETFSGLVPSENIKIFDVPKCADGNRWRARSAEIIREHYIASLSPDAVLLTACSNMEVPSLRSDATPGPAARR